MNGFRVYDNKREEFIVSLPFDPIFGENNNEFCVNPNGKLGFFDYSHDFRTVDEDRYELSWATGWEDRNGDIICQGDVLKRVRDTIAELEREGLEEDGNNYPNPEDLDDVEAWIGSKQGAVGVVRKTAGGFTISRLKGHKWGFYGPEGNRTFDWEEEIEIIGNEFQNPELL